MNPRLRRLKMDYEKIKDDFIGHPFIKVEAIEGDPPEKYKVTYKVKGLRWDNNLNHPVEQNQHEVEVYLHSGYPMEKPKLTLKTELFHPNFRYGTNYSICISDYWAAGETLSDIIFKIGEMIMFQDYNTKSPLDANASKWVNQNQNLLPLDTLNIRQPEINVLVDNIEISFEDDFEIKIN